MKPNEESVEYTVEQLEAKKMQFRFGHMEDQLEIAGEPTQTIENIKNGTYSTSDPVKCETDDSNSYGHE